jgi:CubicO group peptidase (beta-lactamase class C family)
MTTIHGTVAPGFEPVRHAFEENFRTRREIGAACCVYVKGERVVDLWGGYRDAQTRAPWDPDTMVIVFSTTKGMTAVALAVAHSQGLFEWDDPVAKYWPEFAQNGKAEISVRQLLSHQAGLSAVDVPLEPATLANLDELAKVLAAQRPAWQPGTRSGYHAVSIGWYVSELLRRVDPKQRSAGRFFSDEVAKPLGVEFYIGLPASVSTERLARIKAVNKSLLLLKMNPKSLPWPFVRDMLLPKRLAARTFNNPKVRASQLVQRPEYRTIESPASNGIGSARAIARVYASMATGGHELGIKPATLDELKKPPRVPSGGPRDLVLHVDAAFSCGFTKPCSMTRFGSSDTAFGTPGAGGSFGFADPDRELGYAYVMNHMGYHIADDPREKALRDATYACLRKIDG